VEKISVKFNGKDYSVTQGITILAASQETQKLLQEFRKVEIPTLYYLKGGNDIDDSGICVVEVEDKVVNASTTRIKDGMKILSNSEKVIAARKEALAKILAIHHKDCINCVRSTSCELQELLHNYGFTDEPELPKEDLVDIDTSSMVLVRDNNKCIRCKRCINVCAKTQAISAICATGKGLDAKILPSSPDGLAAASCVNCGQCVAVCPVGALYEKDNTAEVNIALSDSEKFVVVEVAPAVRVALGEAFEFPIGVDVEGKVAAALRRLGFDKVFDTKFAADLTIIEEANELLGRIQNDGVLPLVTSCCPGWIKYCEHFYPDMIDNLSTCKSPQQMFGATVKSYYAEKMGIAKEDIVVVSVMPCIAKKFELTRDDECGAGVADVDISITTRELAKMIKDAEIQFEAMPFEDFDTPLGLGTGAGVIFGATGGVMEAALRTAVEKMTGEELSKLDFTDVRGMNGIKEAAYELNGTTIKVAIASGLANANALLTKVKSGEADYQFIEVMACPGGCINGGGQPHQPANIWTNEDVCSMRASALYKNDENSKIRKSHENLAIIELYDTYLGEAGSVKAHQLLHTSYVKR
jgi:NADP-reducing hydrogenase subunit HndD